MKFLKGKKNKEKEKITTLDEAKKKDSKCVRTCKDCTWFIKEDEPPQGQPHSDRGFCYYNPPTIVVVADGNSLWSRPVTGGNGMACSKYELKKIK